MALKTYDASQVSVVIGGSAITGFARDSSIEISYEDNKFSVIKDNRGATTRSKLNSNDALIKINLLQESVSNDLLSDFAILDRTTSAGSFAVFIKDNNGTSLYSSAVAWIEQIPEVSYGIELGTYTWVIRATDTEMVVGGLK